MNTPIPKVQSVFAPAKINLYLHITGKNPNGYHTLDSLVAFADIGDDIQIKPHEQFAFEITGSYAKLLQGSGNTSYIDDDNLVTRAVKALSQITNQAPNFKITLHKELPVASGIGGGSSNAAATLWALIRYWRLEKDADYLLPLMLSLGADVPVCFACQPKIMRGIGEVLIPAPPMPEMPILLVNPNISCATADIFLHHKKEFKTHISIPADLSDPNQFINFLQHQENDLFEASTQVLPEIHNVIHAITAQNGCKIVRMSGSGATCFGLFDNVSNAEKATNILRYENPDWWVKCGILNRPERY